MHIIGIFIQQSKSIEDKRVVIRMKKESYYIEQMYYISLLRAESKRKCCCRQNTIKEVHTHALLRTNSMNAQRSSLIR